MHTLFKSKFIVSLLFALAFLSAIYFLYPIAVSSSTLGWIADKPSFLQHPSVTHDPDSAVPLAAVVTFKADVAVVANYTISDGVDSWEYSSKEYLVHHQQALLRFRAGKKHEIKVKITDKAGHSQESSAVLTFQAPNIPVKNTLPVLTVTAADTANLSGTGLTIASLFVYDKTPRRITDASTSVDRGNSLLVALDERQQVVWFYQADYQVNRLEQLVPGTLVLISASGRETIDFLGNRVDFWQGDRQRMFSTRLSGGVTVEADNLHSKQLLLANGNRLMLSTTMRVLDNYPAAAINNERPEQLNLPEYSPFPNTKPMTEVSTLKSMVVGDSVLEVSSSGEVIERWNLFDLLDVQRASYHGNIPSETVLYPPSPSMGLAKSWTRANSLAFDQSSNTILVSLMHQDAVIGIDKTAGTLKWILGDPSGWREPWSKKLLKPLGEHFSWFYYPSSISLTSNGDIMLLDNGSYRAVPPAKAKSLQQSTPQVKVLAVDEKSMTVKLKSSNVLPLQKNDNGFEDWLALQNLSLVNLQSNNKLLTADGLAGTLSTINIARKSYEHLLSFHTDLPSKQRWGIADVIVTAALTPPTKLSLAVVDAVTGPLLAKSVASTAPIVSEVKHIRADLLLPTHVVDGSWQLQLGEDENAATQSLTLSQEERLVKGALVDYPVVALIKGNTFSMTVRRDNGEGRVRFRYFGVINDRFDHIQGKVSIDQDGVAMAQLDWFANREVLIR